MKPITFIAVLAFCLAIFPATLALGSSPSLGWEEFAADRDALLADASFSEGQKILMGGYLEDIEYYNGLVESAEYDFLLLSDEKSELDTIDYREIRTANDELEASVAGLNSALVTVVIGDGDDGTGYAKALDNLKAARANLDDQLIRASRAVFDRRIPVYGQILVAKAYPADGGLKVAGDSLVSASDNNPRAVRFAQKWVDAGFAEYEEVNDKISHTQVFDILEADQAEFDVMAESAAADAETMIGVLQAMLSKLEQQPPQKGDGKTGFVEVVGGGGAVIPAPEGASPAVPQAPAQQGVAVGESAAQVNVQVNAGQQSANLETSMRSLEIKIGELTTALDNLKINKAKAKSTVTAKKAKAASTKKQASTSKLEKAVESLKKKIKLIDGKINAPGKSAKEISAIRKELMATNEKLGEIQKTLDRWASIPQSVKDVQDAVAKQAGINAQQAAKNAELDGAIANAKTEAAAAKAETWGQIVRETNEAKRWALDAEREAKRVAAENKVLNERIGALEKSTASSANEAMALREQVAELRGKIDGVTAKAAEAEGTVVQTKETLPDGTVRETTVKTDKGAIVNVSGNQQIGQGNTIGEGGGRTGTPGGENPPVVPEPPKPGPDPVTPTPVPDPNIPKPGDPDFIGPVKAPPQLVPPELPKPNPIKKIITSPQAKIAGGFLAAYFITLLTDLAAYMIKSSDYPNDASFIPPSIYSNEKFNKTSETAGFYKQDLKYSEAISFQSKYANFKNFTDKDRAKTAKDSKGNDITVNQTYQYVIFTNAGKNIFALRDTLIDKVAEGTTKKVVLDAVLAASIATRSTMYEYDMASFEPGDPTKDPKLVKGVYIAAFKLKPDGTPENTPVKLDRGGSSYGYFSSVIQCPIGKSVTSWVCDLSALESLPKGKYVAAIFTAVDNGIFTSNDTVIPKAQKALADRKCNFAIEKSDKDYCEFFNTMADQAAIDNDFTTQKDNVLADQGFWTSFGSTVKGAWANHLETKLSPVKLFKDIAIPIFSNPKAIFTHPIDTVWGAQTKAFDAVSGDTMGRLGLIFSPLAGLEIGYKNITKGKLDAEKKFSIILDPSNVSAKNAMALGLPMFEEFEIGTTAATPTAIQAVAPAPSAPLSCPTMAECLACVDKKMVHEVFGNTRDGRYSCIFQPSPASTTAAPTASASSAAGALAKPSLTIVANGMPQGGLEFKVQYESALAWDEGSRAISVWGEDPKGRPCDYYLEGFDDCVFLEGTANAGEKAFGFDTDLMADSGVDTSRPVWIQVELCPLDDETECDNTNAWVVSNAYSVVGR